jgi:hypothetical protein
MPLEEIRYDHYYDSPKEFNFLTVSNYHYELTLTFNPQLYTKVSADKEIPHIIEYLKIIFEQNPIEIFIVVKEYTKIGFPHLHLYISSSTELSCELRSNILKALQRKYGRTSFKDVLDVDAYETYLSKTLHENYVKRGTRHFWTFLK